MSAVVESEDEATTVLRGDEDEILRASPHDHPSELGERAAMERYSDVCHASYCDFCDEWLEGTPYVIPDTMGPTWQKDASGRWLMPERSLGLIAIKWMYAWLQLRGQKFLPTPEQARFIMWMYAIDHRGRFIYRDITLQRLKGWGKDPIAAALCLFELVGPCRFDRWATERDVVNGLAREVGDPIAKQEEDAWVQVFGVSADGPLALDTVVPTPDGPRTMGDLRVGDTVFSSRGEPVRVARETNVLVGEDCYRLTFDDGTTVVASAKHGWTVDYAANGRERRTVTTTTGWLAKHSQYANGSARARIPLAPRLTPDVDLPLDPYLLGVWLGDGTSVNGSICSGAEDVEAMTALLTSTLDPTWEIRRTDESNDRGHRWSKLYVGRRKDLCPRGHDKTLNPTYVNGFPACRTCRRQRAAKHSALDPVIPTFLEELEALGVRGAKSVPSQYIQAGTEQRRALLQGLLDSDGTVSEKGVSFANKNPLLIDAVAELAQSLGHKPNISWHRGCGAVRWQVAQPGVLFRLPRKAARQPAPSQRYRVLRSVEKVDSVPVRCIGIDTEDHLFQVEGGLLTHNTVNTMAMFPQLITEHLKAKAGLEINKQIIYAYGARRRLESVSSNWTSREGNRPTFQIGGEPHHWNQSNGGDQLQKVMTRNATKIEGGQSRILWITNAYDSSRESVGKAARDAYENTLAGDADAGIMYDSLEAPPAARLIEREIPVVLEAVRGDAKWLDIETITKTMLDYRTTPNESRRFYYNQIVADEEGFFRPNDIAATVHPHVKEWRKDPDLALDQAKVGWSLVTPNDDIVLFFDGGKSGDSTAISGCRLSDGYTFVIGHWAKPAKREMEKREDADRWVAPRAAVQERIFEAHERFHVVAFYCDPSHAKDDEGDAPYWMPMINLVHRTFKGQYEVWARKTGNDQHSVLFDMALDSVQAIFVPAAKRFAQAITEHEIQHDGHPQAMNNMRNARQSSSKHGMTMSKRTRKSPFKIDQAVTHAGAYMLRDIVLNTREVENAGGGMW